MDVYKDPSTLQDQLWAQHRTVLVTGAVSSVVLLPETEGFCILIAPGEDQAKAFMDSPEFGAALNKANLGKSTLWN